MNMSSDGTISPIKKLEDGKYHVVGDLAITPGILLRPMYAALEEIVKLCGERKIYILTPLPRYILVPCCDSDTHCVNLVVKDAATRQGVFHIMDELDLIGKAVSIKFSNCTVLCTGDLLVGKKDATRHEVLDAMIANWMNDPVHSTKAGYSKMAIKLAERVEADLVPKAKKSTQKKRAASPEASGSGSGSGGNFSRNVRGRGGSDPGYNFVPGSHLNQRGGWLPIFTRGGSRGGSGRGSGSRGRRGGGGRGRGRAAHYYY
jgi:hypothetical protein